jgi:hypothetical protein
MLDVHHSWSLDQPITSHPGASPSLLHEFAWAEFLFQKWNGTFFERVSLQELGLRIQVGHLLGVACPNPAHWAGDPFVIIDTDMIHTVNLDFCTCGASTQSRTVQLLRSGLFPATVDKPRTAVTFRALEVELLSYVSKISAFEFYHSVSHLTNNTGIDVPKVSLPQH